MKLNELLASANPRSIAASSLKQGYGVAQATKAPITAGPWIQAAADAFIQAKASSSLFIGSNKLPIQCMFPKEEKMYAKNGDLTRGFINYMLTNYSITESDIKEAYNAFPQQEEVITAEQIENKFKSKRITSKSNIESKRTKYNPKPKDGEGDKHHRTIVGIDVQVPGKKGTLTRSCSYDSLANHRPMFVHGGIKCGEYTNVNDNATFSIAGYSVNNVTHLIGGTQSGEHVMDKEEVTHAEHQQILLFEEQINIDAHELKSYINTEGAVTLHLHISKSPCQENCVNRIKDLLDAYPALNIQLYLEVPYLANDPSTGMQEQATSLKNMFDKINIDGKKRISFQIVSAHASKEDECNEPFRLWGSLSNDTPARDMLFIMGSKSDAPQLPESRYQLFKKANLLSHMGHVDNLNLTKK